MCQSMAVYRKDSQSVVLSMEIGVLTFSVLDRLSSQCVDIMCVVCSSLSLSLHLTDINYDT